LERTHRTLKKDVRNIKKGEVLSKKKKMHIWKRESRILGIHSRKKISENRSRKGRSSKQVASATKSERG
jgi:hypothetical protein